MTAPTLTLADFLLARIAEDEVTAQEAHYEGQHWLTEEEGVYRWPDDELVRMADRKADARHIAHWDPARVLAECEAKRRIVEQCRIALDRMCLPLTPGSGRTGEYAVASLTLGFLALPYADHPDFREEWRP